MHTLLKQQIEGRAVLVLGSAPGATAPEDFDPSSWCLICVNGSGWMARRLGLGTPNITIITAGALRKNQPSNMEMRSAIDGLNTDTLIVRLITRNRLKLVLERIEILFRLIRIRYGKNRRFFMARDAWRPILDETIGPRVKSQAGDNFHVSTGVFACLFAAYFGARRIVVSGIDPNSIGHSYSTSNLPRSHLYADRLAIDTLQKKSDIFFVQGDSAS